MGSGGVERGWGWRGGRVAGRLGMGWAGGFVGRKKTRRGIAAGFLFWVPCFGLWGWGLGGSG